MPTTITTLSNRIASILKDVAASKGPSSSSWFTTHMAAARRAILNRIPLVDYTVEVRDARAPVSSAFELMGRAPISRRRIILLNKVDLADRCETEKWVKHFHERNCHCYPVNAHNKESIKGLLNFVRERTKELEVDQSSAVMFLLVGIPNVGKSAIVNAMHQTGRISSAEKGKLRHATGSPSPGETKGIRSFKIASHPNMYILDTPGVLPPVIPDDRSGANLALIGSINDILVGEPELASYFLAILNLGNKYNHWENLGARVKDKLQHKGILLESDTEERERRQYIPDHTQDLVVKDVRWALFRTISQFGQTTGVEAEMEELIKVQFIALHEAFRVPLGTGEEGHRKVAAKLLNLYRTGRLGHHTLEPFPGVKITLKASAIANESSEDRLRSMHCELAEPDEQDEWKQRNQIECLMLDDKNTELLFRAAMG